MHGRKTHGFSSLRYKVIALIFIVIVGILLTRLLYLTTIDRGFLLDKGLQEANHPRVIPANRGVIFDRNGVPLAVSAPIDNIIFDAKVLSQDTNDADWHALATSPVLDMSLDEIRTLVFSNPTSRHVIVIKNLPPSEAAEVDNLNVPGVYVERNHQSFYPQGTALAQFVGFTDVNDTGQDAIELAYEKYLAPIYGKQYITTSALGQVYSINQLVKDAQDGHDLYLSIDSRLQYVAYQALSAQVQKTDADWGSVVILNPHTGEVLAAVSYPSFNPNSTTGRSGIEVQDQAITSTIEPGSTMKPVTITAALESGQYQPNTPIDTNPGSYMLDNNKIQDDSNFGLINVTKVITKSSNVGISKIALSLPRKVEYNMFLKAGISQKPSGGKFPGEASGFIYPLNILGDFQFATMAFGYSVTASTLQMARYYAAIANGGVLMPITYVKLDTPPSGQRIMSADTANEMINILKTVVNPNDGGTGILANVPGYVVAGKTGTAHIVNPKGGYFSDHNNALFAGMIPANNPQLVIVVLVSNPKAAHFYGYGGIGAAPVFAQIALAAMHILGIPPSNDQINLKLFQNQQQYYQQLIEA
jgi:cell division protein FtsI (penicillin-binding protein 3)